MGSSGDRLCQTSPIPRSPDGDNNARLSKCFPRVTALTKKLPRTIALVNINLKRLRELSIIKLVKKGKVISFDIL